MSAPNFLFGVAQDGDNSAKPSTGIFGKFPGATPKYAKNIGLEEDFKETLARLFIQLNSNDYSKFLDSVPSETKPLATVLAGTNGTDGASGGTGYIDFLLQTADHSFQEKVDVVEVLSDNYVAYFFGESAPVFNYTANLINTYQDDQAINMLRIYRDMTRGTQLAIRNQIVRMRYDSMLVSGAMTNLRWAMNSENEMSIPASWSLLVKSVTLLPNNKYGIVKLTDPFTDLKSLPLLTSTNTNSTTKISVMPPAIVNIKTSATNFKPTTELRVPSVTDTKSIMRAFTS